MAKEKGLTYVKLDGNVGILANGAGLCMSTLDVVAQAGGAPANFLDAGGGSKAEAIVNALEVIASDAEGHRDPLQHLRRHHPLRRDRQGDRHRLGPDRPRGAAGRPPRRHQLRGGPGDPRRGRPAQPAPGEDDAGRGAPRRRAGGGRVVSIIVGEQTKLVVSGLTGREGSFHGLRNRAYGTDLVAGVTPGKGGQDVEGVPVFDTIKEAVEEAGANTSMIFVPARFAAPAIDEAIESGVRDGDRDHRGDPGARHAEDLLEGEGGRGAADRAQLPRRALARQGQRRHHPRPVLRPRQDRRRLQVGDADLPDRQRAEAGGRGQLLDRRHRRRPDRRLRLHRHPRRCTRPTRRPS